MINDIYEGDVLEHALNFGIQSSSQRFHLEENTVKKIVLNFQEEIEDTPTCMYIQSDGRFLLPSRITCFQCTADGLGHRILIKK